LILNVAPISTVMPALVAGIHAWRQSKAWMAGTSPAMTTVDSVQVEQPAKTTKALAFPRGLFRFDHRVEEDFRFWQTWQRPTFPSLET
jgi:hypothetical protein